MDSGVDGVPAATQPGDLERRVVDAAEQALADGGVVTLADVLNLIGWLPATHIDRWRQGRADSVLESLQVRPEKFRRAVDAFLRWAGERGLTGEQVVPLARTRQRGELSFTGGDAPDLERVFRTQWMSDQLADRARERIVATRSKAPDLVVIDALKKWTCTRCNGTGDLLVMEGPGPLCLDCADLGHLVFLAAGDATLTRRAKRASGLSAVVVRFARSRHRYERRGILVEPAALERAEQQCLADEQARAGRSPISSHRR
jgi:hypothetical protein